MSQLHDNLKDRLADMFFGVIATQILDGEHMPSARKRLQRKISAMIYSMGLTI